MVITVPCYWASFQWGEPDVSEHGLLVGALCGEKASQPPLPPHPAGSLLFCDLGHLLDPV